MCFATASYASALKEMGASVEDCRRVYANEVLVLSLTTKVILSRHSVFHFDLNQHKTSTEDFQRAFINAVDVRSKGVKHRLFVGVSSGYDAGAIMLALELLQRPFLRYYIPHEDKVRTGNEDELVVQARVDYLHQMEATRLQLNRTTYREHQDLLARQCETSRGRGGPQVGYSLIASEARKRNGLIFLSGVGVDEIISMYSMNGHPIAGYPACKNSTFPDNLKGFFPWCSFYRGSMHMQIAAVEMTGGAHGIEARYPFLDPLVVQEFLWLTAKVRNSEYKRPVADFLRTHNFPNMWGKKAGMPFFFHDDQPIANQTSTRAFVRHSSFGTTKKLGEPNAQIYCLSQCVNAVSVFGMMCLLLRYLRRTTTKNQKIY